MSPIVKLVGYLYGRKLRWLMLTVDCISNQRRTLVCMTVNCPGVEEPHGPTNLRVEGGRQETILSLLL